MGNVWQDLSVIGIGILNYVVKFESVEATLDNVSQQTVMVMSKATLLL